MLENRNVQCLIKVHLISIPAFQGFLCFSFLFLFFSFYYVGSGDQTQALKLVARQFRYGAILFDLGAFWGQSVINGTGLVSY